MSAAIDAAQRRGLRAAIARRLLHKAPAAAATLDWAMLGTAPEWLAMPEPALALFARRIGALSCAAAMQLWIDGARIAAARMALGAPFFQALLAERGLPAVPPAGLPRLDVAEQVGPLLQAAGAGVLVASLPPGTLQRAAGDVVGPFLTLQVAPALAHALIDRTRALEAPR